MKRIRLLAAAIAMLLLSLPTICNSAIANENGLHDHGNGLFHNHDTGEFFQDHGGNLLHDHGADILHDHNTNEFFHDHGGNILHDHGGVGLLHDHGGGNLHDHGSASLLHDHGGHILHDHRSGVLFHDQGNGMLRVHDDTSNHDHTGHESGDHGHDHGDKGGIKVDQHQHQSQSQQTSVKASGFGGLAIVVIGGVASSRATGCSTCRHKKRPTLPEIKDGKGGQDSEWECHDPNQHYDSTERRCVPNGGY